MKGLQCGWICRLLGCLMLWLSGGCGAATIDTTDISQVDIAFAGLALSGSDADISTQYPHISILQTALARNLHQRIQDIRPAHYRLHTDNLLNREHGYSVAMAMVVDDESVIVEKIGDLYKAITEISAKALVYDFDGEEKAIIAVYQVPIDSYVEVFEKKPSYDALHKIFTSRLLQAEDSVLNRFLATVEAVDIKQKYAQEVGIGKITFGERARAYLPEHWRRDRGLAQRTIARRFASFLSANQQVSVIPYGHGNTGHGNTGHDNTLSKMALRFTGQPLTTLLDLPEVDYFIDIDVRAFAKKQIDAKASGASYLYAVGIGLTARESTDLGGEVVFRQNIKNSVGKAIYISQTEIDDWPYFNESLYSGFDRFTQAISASKSTWLRHQKFDRAGRKELKSFREMLAKCQ